MLLHKALYAIAAVAAAELDFGAALLLRFSSVACGASAIVAFAPAQLQQASPQLLPLEGGGRLSLKFEGLPMLQCQEHQGHQHTCCHCCCCSQQPGTAGGQTGHQGVGPAQPALLRMALFDNPAEQPPPQQLQLLLKAWLWPNGVVVCRCPPLRSLEEKLDLRECSLSSDELLGFESHGSGKKLPAKTEPCAWEGTASAFANVADATEQQHYQHCIGWCVFGVLGGNAAAEGEGGKSSSGDGQATSSWHIRRSVLPLGPRGLLVGRHKRHLKHWFELQKRTAGNRIISASLQVTDINYKLEKHH